MRSFLLSITTLIALMQVSPSYAAYTVRGGKLVKKEEAATLPVQEHYALGIQAMEKKKWDEVIAQNTIIIKSFPESPFTEEAIFHMGVAYFHIQEYELANEQFSDYLKKPSAPKHFQETMEYKFQIAESFRKGTKKRLLGLQKMPKIIPADEEAISIYEEVISALPNHEMAVHSLFGKAEILLAQQEFRSSVETYQTLIRRFGKHPLAPESYVGIGKTYLKQCKTTFADPDFLDLAEINLRKFKQDFPREDRVAQVQKMLDEMKEIYARSLYDIAKFYERTNKDNAAKIYYSQIVTKYPDTKLASVSRKRIEVITKKLEKMKQAIPVAKNETLLVEQDEKDEILPCETQEEAVELTVLPTLKEQEQSVVQDALQEEQTLFPKEE